MEYGREPAMTTEAKDGGAGVTSSNEASAAALLTPESEALFTAAIRMRDAGRLEEARATAKRALLALPPEHRLARGAVTREIGFTYQLAEDREAALEWYLRSRDLLPRSELSSLTVFHGLMHLGRVDEALDEALRFVHIKHSPEYDELFATAFRDDVAVAHRERADRIRAELTARAMERASGPLRHHTDIRTPAQLLERVLERWGDDGVPASTRASEERLTAFEQLHDCRIPLVLRGALKHADGFAPEPAVALRFLPVGEMFRPRVRGLVALLDPGVFVFLTRGAAAYAVDMRRDQPSRVFLIDEDASVRQVADELEAFLVRYVTGDDLP